MPICQNCSFPWERIAVKTFLKLKNDEEWKKSSESHEVLLFSVSFISWVAISGSFFFS